MAILNETLRLLITGDGSGAVQEFRKVGKAAEADLGKAETQAEKTSAKLTKMGAASLAAGGVAAAALMSTIGPASDLAEAINVTGLVFEDNAAEMEDWSKTAATAFGLARDQALSAASQIGGLLKNVGFTGDEVTDLSQDLVQLAADMGSAFNMSTADALEAIRSGLAGEAEPLKKFNVFLSEAAVNAKAMELGISDGTGALSEHEKAQARLAIIMEQTSDIQGDFAATADGAANSSKVAAAQFRDMKAAIGTELLPIVTEVLGALNSLLSTFNALPDPIQGAIGKAAIFGTGLLLLGGTVLSVAGRVKDLNAAVRGLSGRFPTAAKGAGLMGAAVAGAALAFSEYQKHAAETEAKTQAVADAFRDGATEGEQWTAAVEGIIAADGGMLAARMEEYGLTIMEVRSAWREAAGDGDAFYEILAGLGDGVDANGLKFTGLFNVLEAGFADLEAEAARAEGATDGFAGSVDSAYRSAVPAARAVFDLSEGMGSSTVKAREFEVSLSDVTSAIDKFFGSVQSAQEIEAGFAEAIDGAVAALEEHGATLDLDTEAGRANLQARGDIIASIDEQVGALVAEGASTDEIRGKVRASIQAYRDALRERGLNREQIQELTGDLNNLPAEVITQLEMAGYDDTLAKLAEVQRQMAEIPREIRTYVSITGTGAYQTQAETGTGLAAEDRSVSGRKFRSAGGRSFGGGGGDTIIEIDHRTELDSRTLLRSIERISTRDGGARIRIRAAD